MLGHPQLVSNPPLWTAHLMLRASCAHVLSLLSVIRLSDPKNIEEFARVMYSALRDADAKGLHSVVVAEPAGDGLALAIRDRLMRASKGR